MESADPTFWQLYGEAAKTALGFFWKAGWAFVMGYAISAMIQVFVPKHRLVRHMGELSLRSTTLATAFGSISSSCSFAALAAARALFAKGAHFILAVAFMFASTNLVIELGILILIFLGWQFLVAEIIGGLVLILISSVLIRSTYPRRWIEQARDKVEGNAPEEEEFSPLERMRSARGWQMVGNQFVMEWKMVWKEILIGFTVAGFMKVFVPEAFWKALFLQGYQDTLPELLIVLENAIVGPFVAALTFIGSMGNIPLATVLAGSGVTFAGVMAFIYSDLMVPPLVRVNAKYYGWRVALYIAGIMFVSIVATALILHFGFAALGLTPDAVQSAVMSEQFAIDYTFFLNIAFVALAGGMIFLHRRYQAGGEHSHHDHDHGGGFSFQDWVVLVFITGVVLGMIAFAVTGGVSAGGA
ncbi:permease [Marinobacter orientalis]|uniref:Permease n=1 Tax=Marinobacter orientalis TaxID=1928859 RepID=A0A7Y0RAJ5_9GAMM|nr:permease [Marinobacter orientalis]NMT62102.1 permease [Marinobacter orientalis]TGX50823.1 permease [Marinobacter orientalis]